MHRSIHPFIHSSIHSYRHRLIHPFIHPSIHSSIDPYIHPCIHQYIYRSLCLLQSKTTKRFFSCGGCSNRTTILGECTIA
jgi:hypothetical protein